MKQNADTLRTALRQVPRYSRLPPELRNEVEQHVPVLHAQDRIARLKEERLMRNAGDKNVPNSATATQANPSIAPQDGSAPFLDRLPPEIRRAIFTEYLFPSKVESIEPVQHRKRRETLLKKRSLVENASRRLRNTIQQRHQISLQGPAQWQNQLLQPAPNPQQQLPFPPAPNPQQTGQVGGFMHFLPIPAAIGQVPTMNSAAVTSHGATPLTGNPLNWPGNPILNNPPPMPLGQTVFAAAPTGSPFLPNLIALQAALVHGQQPRTNQVGTMSHPVARFAEDDAEGDGQAQHKTLRAGVRAIRKYDDTPERVIIPLMLTNSKLCLEVATILYEEYTFQIHIHHDGVELLGFERIPTLENWGLEIEKTMGAFKGEKQFCFQRMKHLEFVFFGGDPKDRLAGLRMRESTSKLVDFLKKEKNPVTSVKVRFQYEKKNNDQEYKVESALTDDLGNFWTSHEKRTANNNNNDGEMAVRGPRSSIIHDVYNVQLVSVPLKGLHGVTRVTFEYPNNIGVDVKLAAETAQVRALMMAHEVSYEKQDEIMREEQMMDARRDIELTLAGAGGYYKKSNASTGGFPVSKYLVDEADMEEEGLCEAFGRDQREYNAMDDIAMQWQREDEQEQVDEMMTDIVPKSPPVDISLQDDAIRAASTPSTGPFSIRGETDVEQSNGP